MRTPLKQSFRYLPVSEREQDWGLYVKAAGIDSIEPWGPFPLAGHPPEFLVNPWRKGRILQNYQAHYVTRGEGHFESKPNGAKSNGAKKIVAGNVFLLFPGVWHHYEPVPAIGWDDYWVDFNGQDVERLVQNGFISPQNPVLNTGLDDRLLHAYVTLLDRLFAEPIGFEQLLAASAMEILATMLAVVRTQQADGQYHELICRAKSLLETQSGDIPSIENLATSFNLSPTHFHRIFKQHTGLSPYQYYLELRMERAKQMLHGTKMSIKEISVALAFENPFHFSRAFKRKTGMSPSQWRQQGHHHAEHE